jgi:hypothetical protein
MLPLLEIRDGRKDKMNEKNPLMTLLTAVNGA